MSKSRRLRRLTPDEALFERRAGGEPFRQLAPDYGVVPSTLVRFFQRRAVELKLREVGQRLQMERKALREEERQLERDVRRRAREEAAHDRWLKAWTWPKRLPRTEYEAWLDGNDAPRVFASWERYSTNDESAERAVAAGGGTEEVTKVTGLPNRKEVLQNIDAQILARALANDARRLPRRSPNVTGLRRLAPDLELISRRAAGETLRRLAEDYGVSHTTLSRYFNRPEITKLLRAERRRQRGRRGRATRTPAAQGHLG